MREETKTKTKTERSAMKYKLMQRKGSWRNYAWNKERKTRGKNGEEKSETKKRRYHEGRKYVKKKNRKGICMGIIDKLKDKKVQKQERKIKITKSKYKIIYKYIRIEVFIQ